MPVETAMGAIRAGMEAAGRTHAHSASSSVACLQLHPGASAEWRPDAEVGRCRRALGGQVAEAKSRFNIVTLTTYLIDISFFFFFCNVTICGQRRRCRFKKLIFIKCERHSY